MIVPRSRRGAGAMALLAGIVPRVPVSLPLWDRKPPLAGWPLRSQSKSSIPGVARIAPPQPPGVELPGNYQNGVVVDVNVLVVPGRRELVIAWARPE